MYSISFLGQAVVTVDAPAVVRLILKDQDIPEKPGTAAPTTYDRLLKYASERIIQRKYGLAIDPYAVWRAVYIDKSIPESELRKAENAVKAELKDIGIKRGPKGMKAWFKAEEYAPIKAVKTIFTTESGFVAASIQAGLDSIGIRYDPAGTVLTHEECERLRGAALSYIQKADIEDPDIRIKRAAEELSMKIVRGMIPFYRVMRSMGISCIVPISPEGHVFKPTLRSMKLHGVKSQSGFRSKELVLAPDLYDSIVNTAARISMQEWEAHKLKAPDPKFRTREVTGGEAEWRRIVAQRFTQLQHYHRGELPVEKRPYTREAAIRAVQTFQKQALQRLGIPLRPGTLSAGVWKELINFPISWPASIAMAKLLPHRMMAASEREILQAGGPYVRNRSGSGPPVLTSLARSVVSEALTGMGYRQASHRELYRPLDVPTLAPAVVKPIVVKAAAAPAVVRPTPARRITETNIKRMVNKRAFRIRFSTRNAKKARWLSSEAYQKFIRDCIGDARRWETLPQRQRGIMPTVDPGREAEISQTVVRYMVAYGVLPIAVIAPRVQRPKAVARPTVPSPLPVAPPPAPALFPELTRIGPAPPALRVFLPLPVLFRF